MVPTRIARISDAIAELERPLSDTDGYLLAEYPLAMNGQCLLLARRGEHLARKRGLRSLPMGKIRQVLTRARMEKRDASNRDLLSALNWAFWDPR